MRQPIGRRSETCQRGARTTTSPSKSTKQRSWLWTTGNGGLSTPPTTSMGMLWNRLRDWRSLVSTLLRLTCSTHSHSCEEGTTVPLPPQKAEKIWHGPPDPQKILQLHYCEYLDWLHHCLIWQQQGTKTPANRILFSLLPHGKWYSLYPQAIRLLNKAAK
jgi:hypothetical protein